MRAWEDIVANHLYVTGTTSHGEHFGAPHELPNVMSPNVGETCVTVTWLQLTQQLLRLTGEARFGSELERTAYNQLAAAQRPDGRQWCYYTALEGTKPYGPGISCCVSSGPRGMALLPTVTYGQASGDRLVVNLFETSSVTLELDGVPVTVEQISGVPFDGGSELRFLGPRPVRTGLLIRAPSWADRLRIRDDPPARTNADGWLELQPRIVGPDDVIHIEFEVGGRAVVGEHGNRGKVAIAHGPLVLAYDTETSRPDRRRTPAFDVLDEGQLERSLAAWTAARSRSARRSRTRWTPCAGTQ